MLTAYANALAMVYGVSPLTIHLLGTLGLIPFIVVVVLSIAVAIWIARLPSEEKPPNR